MNDRSQLLTEQQLTESSTIDAMSIVDAVALMNQQDEIAVSAVAKERYAIARAVELVAKALANGGRLIYVGAGTSGRLGVLDASECPPTFRTDPTQVQAIIAGGPDAMFRSKEGAEDSAEGGADAIEAFDVTEHDVVFGIAAGGTTPFVHGALQHAKTRGGKTVFLCCVANVPNETAVDVVIRPLTGPEVVTGSTRLKAGTATKLVLNTVTTLAMVRLGKVYGNLMVDLRCTNDKLWDRGARIVSTVTGLNRDDAMKFLRDADGWVKAAIVMQQRGMNREAAERLLSDKGGRLRDVIDG